MIAMMATSKSRRAKRKKKSTDNSSSASRTNGLIDQWNQRAVELNGGSFSKGRQVTKENGDVSTPLKSFHKVELESSSTESKNLYPQYHPPSKGSPTGAYLVLPEEVLRGEAEERETNHRGGETKRWTGVLLKAAACAWALLESTPKVAKTVTHLAFLNKKG